MRVLILGAFQPDYARHYVIREGLQRIGVAVETRLISLDNRTPGRVRELISLFPRPDENFDVVIIAAFNQLIAPFAWFLARHYHQPLLLDYLVGLADAAEDRGHTSQARLKVFRMIDRFNTHNIITITDTAAHKQAFVDSLRQTLPKMYVLPVGVRDLQKLPPPTGEAVVQYTGTYIPFHGVDIMLRAAQRLPHVRFEFIGKGQTYPQARRLGADLNLTNVHFIHGYFSKDDLTKMQARSTIMLGVFGDSHKTRYVVPTKIFEALALGRPLITAEAPAMHELFKPGQHMLTTPPGDYEALAAAVQRLVDSKQLAAQLRDEGCKYVESAFTPEHIAVRLRDILLNMEQRSAH